MVDGVDVTTFGPAGACIAVLLWVIKMLRDDLKQARDDNRELAKQKDTDQRAMLPALTLATAAMNDMSQLVERLYYSDHRPPRPGVRRDG